MVVKRFFGEILNKTDTSNLIRVSDPFVKELLAIWSEVFFEDKVATKEQFLSSPLDGKPVFNRDWFLKGITEIRHLMDNSDKFLSPSSFESRYDVQLRPLNFFGIIAAARCLRRQNTDSPSSNYCSFFSNFLRSAKPSKLIYNKLVLSESKQPLRSQGKWCKEICPEPEEDHEINWNRSIYIGFRVY